MLVAAAWLVPALFGAINEIAQSRLWNGSWPAWRQVVFTFFDWLIYAVLTPFVFLVSGRWRLARPHLASHAVLHFVLSLLFCAAWAGLGTLLRLVISPDAMADRGIGFAFTTWLFITLPFGVAVYLAVVGIEHAFRWYREARERDAQLAQARFDALQSQLNPHFLFNTLNTIAVRVRDADTSGATAMIEQLSALLRRTLAERPAAEVRLDDELELIRQYVAIEQARFSDRLRVTFAIGDGLGGAAVPGFALQHLVENAVRHGVARRLEAGRIAIGARRDGSHLLLTVVDDGPGIDPAAPAPRGHGIENTRERLRALHGERASLTFQAATGGGTLATLRLPYREIDAP